MKAILAVLLFVAFSANANTFPVDEPVMVEAPMCLDQKSAEVLAVEKMQPTEAVRKLVLEKKCGMVRGVVIYRKQVAKNGDWTVWEVQFGQYTLYEATDWKVQKKGVET